MPKPPAKKSAAASAAPRAAAPAAEQLTHRALALAYRPQTFEDVAGQRHITDVLAKAVEHDRVAHAYLFSGPRGTGKTTTARILAKVLNCPNRKGSTPCNVCETCRDITNGSSLDVIEVDGASNRGIADVQQLREAVQFAPTGGRSKVYIIDEVHQLSNDAFAALLKTLEEPPPHVVFIFATTDPLKLPDTIRSRTQRYEFARVAVRTIADRLLTIAREETKAGRKLVLDEGAALLIARKAEGGLRDAVSALDQVASTGRSEIDEATVSEVLGLVSRETFFDLADPIFARDAAATLSQLHRAYDGGFDPRDLAEGLLEHFRNVLVLKVDPKASDLLAATPEQIERYRTQSEAYASSDVLRLLRLTTETIGLLREASQPLLHLEAGLLEMAHLEPGKTLAEILARLDEVEDGGGGGGARPPAPTRTTSAPAPTPRRAEVPVASRPAPSIPALDTVRPATRPSIGARAALDGPPPAPADFDAPGSWGKVVAAVLEKKRMLGHFLEGAHLAGWQENVAVLEVEVAHRGLIEHRDHRTIIVTAMRDVYGRDLDYRCADRRGAAPAAPAASRPAAQTGGEPEPVPPPDEPPPGALDAETVATTPPAAPARKHPAQLSEGARDAMLWLDGEIVGPATPGN